MLMYISEYRDTIYDNCTWIGNYSTVDSPNSKSIYLIDSVRCQKHDTEIYGRDMLKNKNVEDIYNINYNIYEYTGIYKIRCDLEPSSLHLTGRANIIQ